MPRFSPHDRPDGFSLSRRRFVQGAAAAGVLAATASPWRTALAAMREPLLKGTRFDFEIGANTVNITGRDATATLVNQLLPAPILRWREGDTVTLAVANRLDEPTSIHRVSRAAALLLRSRSHRLCERSRAFRGAFGGVL